MKKMFLLLIMTTIVCLMSMPAMAEVTTTRPECASYATGKIVVKGTAFDVMRLQAEPHVEVQATDIKGKVVGGNMVFEYTPRAELNCFTFKSGSKWALIDPMAIKQWARASGRAVGGAVVYKADVKQGFCLRVRSADDREVERFDEYTN